MEAVVLEVYDRRGQVRFRQKLTALPVTLGRALCCDVILDDPLVSAIHARLEEGPGGALVLVDLASRNGLVHGKTRVERITFPAEKPIQLGGTRIGVRPASSPAEATGVHRISRLDQPWLLAPALALVIGGSFLGGSLALPGELQPLKVVGDTVLPMLILLGIWAVGWAIASRISQGRFGFVGHLTLASFGVAGLEWSTNAFGPALAFILQLSPSTAVRLGDATTFIAAWVLGHHLLRVTGWTRRRCLLIGCSLAAAGMVVFELDRTVKALEFEPGVALSSVALPPAFVVGGGESVDQFLARTTALQAEVDALRTAR